MMARLVDLELIIVRFTDNAVLVQSDEDSEEIWLPLSQIEIQDEGGICEITMPELLALEKGLV